jgi:hypothetical protein
MGIAYSLVAGSLWPLMSYNVDEKISSTCYGIMQSLQLLGLFIAFRSSGYIRELNIPENLLTKLDVQSEENTRIADLKEYQKTNYGILQIFFIIVSLISILFTITLILNKGLHGYDINKKKESKEDRSAITKERNQNQNEIKTSTDAFWGDD